MDALTKYEFSFKNPFVPLTTTKAVLLIVIIGFVVYGNMLFNGFVEDDKIYIINDSVTHIADIGLWFGHNSFNNAGQYRAIPAAYFSILYNLFGTTPFFYHLLQIILHVICVILLYFLFRRFFTSAPSLFLSLVFLVHPINVESVSYIAQTVNPLFFLSGIIPMLLITKKRLRNKDFIVICVLSLFSLFTKETGFLFLIILLLYSLLIVKKYLLKLSICAGLTIIIYAFFRFGIAKIGFETRQLTPIVDLSFTERLLHIPAIIFYYLKTFFFPSTLSINQKWVIHSFDFSTFYFPLIFIVVFFLLIGVVGYFIYKYYHQYRKVYLFFCIWFAIGLFLHLQIFPLDKTVADRWFYFPLAGFLGLLGAAYQSLAKKFPRIYISSLIFAVLIISFLSVRTILRNTEWKDAITLYTHDIQYSDNYDIRNNLGTEYYENKEFDKAIAQFQKSIEQRTFEYNIHNIAIAYKEKGDIQKAKKYYAMALRAKNYNLSFPHKHGIISYIDYSTLLIFYDDASLAIPVLRDALTDYPNSDVLWFRLALAKYKIHDRPGALEAATKAYNINPSAQNSYVFTHISDNETFSIKMDNRYSTFP